MALWKRKRSEPPLSEAERQFQLEHERIMRPEMRNGSEILKNLFSRRKKKRKRR